MTKTTGSISIKGNKFYCVLKNKCEGEKWETTWKPTNLIAINENKVLAYKMLYDLMYVKKLCSKKSKAKSKNKKVLFKDLALDWLEHKKLNVRLVTLSDYKIVTNKDIIPYFDKFSKYVDEISLDTILEYYKFLLNKKLSKSALKHRKIIINQILDFAILKNIINQNVSRLVKIPKIHENTTSNKNFLNSEEVETLLEMFKEEKIYPLIFLTVFYGLRRSEVAGLRWKSIDFEKNLIKIDHTAVASGNIVVRQNTTKNESSRKNFTITDKVRNLLINQIKTQERFKQQNNNYVNSGYVFTYEDGSPLKPEYITKRFAKIIKINNFKKLRFHDLRHSCASILFEKGFNIKEIQEWLGHADIQTTMNIYTHISKEHKKEMTEKFSKVFV